MKISKEEQEQLIIDFSYAAERYMREIGCIREADNVEPVWCRTSDICEAVGAAPSIWPAIRDKMIELSIPLSLAVRGGYYIGKPGEQSTLLKHGEAQIRGIANSLHEKIIAMARDGKTMEEVAEFASTRLQMDVKDIPKYLRALSNPLPAQIEVILLEASKREYAMAV
jgi:hypothetical protein